MFKLKTLVREVSHFPWRHHLVDRSIICPGTQFRSFKRTHRTQLILSKQPTDHRAVWHLVLVFYIWTEHQKILCCVANGKSWRRKRYLPFTYHCFENGSLNYFNLGHRFCEMRLLRKPAECPH